MAFDQSTRNRLQKFVSSAREILADEFVRQLQSVYGMDPKQGTLASTSSLKHLDDQQRQIAHQLRETFEYYLANTPGKGDKDRAKQVLDRIVREQAFTVLNRLSALRMAEARGFLIESIANGQNSEGFKLYKYACENALGETGDAYRQYVYALFDEFSLDLAVLFDRNSSQGRLFPRDAALQDLLNEINHPEIEPLWAEDETIGWIYQYFNSQEERKKMRAESQAPRNSRELAVRNQFFTPRYVVEFLTDNTLGRIWYEMTQGNTALVNSCRYLVRRPTEIFLKSGETAPEAEASNTEALSQEELLKQPVYIPHRPLKDPRCIRMLDPACGSMHFGLYAFDLFERIYLEAWQLEQQLGPDAFTREAGQQALQSTFDSVEAFKQQIPKLIIEHNIHGVDIDPRAVQIAGLSLWQRAQRAWHQQGIKPQQRPTIVKSNIVCAEPMPGEKALLQEFTSKLNPPVLGQLLEVIFDKMQLAGEAGTLLKIEEEIQTAIHEAREQWLKQSGSNSVGDLFQAELDSATPQAKLGFDLRGIDDETFWGDAEQRILQALSDYADQAESNADQKRLFAEDAAKGFAFIDLCRKRFDVVLMNPPFGLPSAISKIYIFDKYLDEKYDVFSGFVSRAVDILCHKGLVGSLTNRTCFALESLTRWRLKNFLGQARLLCAADLGYGVLDDAMVEAAAYIVEKDDQIEDCIVFNLLSSTEKEAELNTIFDASSPLDSNRVAYHKLDSFRNIPSSPIAYYVAPTLIAKFINAISVSEGGMSSRSGLQTNDDFRFLRLLWEVPENEVGLSRKWHSLSKGGEYQPLAIDLHIVANWLSDGYEMKAVAESLYAQWSRTIQSVDFQLKAGITYSERTTSDLSFRIMPSGTLFTKTGPGIFGSEDQIFYLLAFSFSRIFRLASEMYIGSGDDSVSGSAARHYRSALISKLPFQLGSNDFNQDLIEKTKDGIDSWFSIIRQNEEHYLFNPAEVVRGKQSIKDVATTNRIRLFENLKVLSELLEFIEISASKQFELSSEDLKNLDLIQGYVPTQYPSFNFEQLEELRDLWGMNEDELVDLAKSRLGARRQLVKKSYFVDRKLELISHILKSDLTSIIECISDFSITDIEISQTANLVVSIAAGIVLGRWKLDDVTSDMMWKLDYFGVNKTTYLANSDSQHIHDLDSFSSAVFLTLRKFFPNDETVDSIHDIVGSKSLNSYFGNVSANSFFSNHINLYSKSRRSAPIYWPLQTLSGSYTLWVYYHRLNEQTLYTCVNDFIDGPSGKLTQVEQDLNGLRSKSARNTQEEKELEKLSDLASELRDFRDELLRLAKFWKPNLNDGVQITAAPLWKLFQHKAWQKKLKETWERLEKGDYDWAHLACSIWPERVLRKCHQDRSLAIAHDVEAYFWHEVEVPVKRGKKLTGETKRDWQPQDLNEPALLALITQIKEERGL